MKASARIITRLLRPLRATWPNKNPVSPAAQPGRSPGGRAVTGERAERCRGAVARETGESALGHPAGKHRRRLHRDPRRQARLATEHHTARGMARHARQPQATQNKHPATAHRHPAP